ncbi:MAG: hypothetical protein UCH28_04525 [Adlercreutzia sp.]|nr:hypothetical protein [Adlercreutzia sp.]
MEDRRRVIERLLAAHEAWFDVQRNHRFAGRTFPGYAEFHSTASQYVLVKRAKLWEASSHEYLFFCETPHLDEAAWRDLLSFMTTEALAKVTLEPDHMSSYLSLVVVADKVDEEVARSVRKAHFRKNFLLGLRGWVDLRVAVVDLGRGEIDTNTQGKPLRETLAANAFAGGASAREEGEGAAVATALDAASSERDEAAAEASAARASSR